jgi:hypothetical protein
MRGEETTQFIKREKLESGAFGAVQYELERFGTAGRPV